MVEATLAQVQKSLDLYYKEGLSSNQFKVEEIYNLFKQKQVYSFARVMKLSFHRPHVRYDYYFRTASKLFDKCSEGLETDICKAMLGREPVSLIIESVRLDVANEYITNLRSEMILNHLNPSQT